MVLSAQQDRAFAIASAGGDTPSLEHALTILAYHLRVIATDPRPTGLYFYAPTPGIRISIAPMHADRGDVWDTVILRHAETGATLYQGNRAGAGDAYALLCAPAIARIAAKAKP